MYMYIYAAFSEVKAITQKYLVFDEQFEAEVLQTLMQLLGALAMTLPTLLESLLGDHRDAFPHCVDTADRVCVVVPAHTRTTPVDFHQLN